ncbi:MAG: dTMP kinase [Firmicutes bacterium]|nr:dTMP kinase [Bacillota bacterium]
MGLGLFVSMEGPDGSGKTLQMDLLEKKLREEGYEVVRSREPGGTEVGEAVRQILLTPSYSGMDAVTEALLFAAQRRQHVMEKIRPALAEGKIVLLDRYVDSSLVYQGIGRGLGMDFVQMINELAIDGLYPDVTFLVYVDYEEGLRRKRGQSGHTLDRLEKEKEDFHRMINQGYYFLAERDPGRVILIDGARSPEEVAGEIWQKMQGYLQTI